MGASQASLKRLVGVLKWWCGGSMSKQPDSQLLTTSSSCFSKPFLCRVINGVMEVHKDDHWGEATGWMIERPLITRGR